MNIGAWLPMLSMLSGFVGLYVNFRDGSSRWRWLVPAMIVLTGTGTMLAARQSAVNSAKSETAKAEAYAAQLKDVVVSVNQHTDEAVAQQALLRLSGAKEGAVTSATTQELNASTRAVVLKQEAVSKLAAPEQSSLQIQYFPHFLTDVNPSAMVAALKQVTPNVAQAPAIAMMSQQKTNCIWVGDQVTADEARAVALTLASAGIDVKDIRRLKNGGGARARLVQIGSSADAARMPTLTADEIKQRNVPASGGD